MSPIRGPFTASGGGDREKKRIPPRENDPNKPTYVFLFVANIAFFITRRRTRTALGGSSTAIQRRSENTVNRTRSGIGDDKGIGIRQLYRLYAIRARVHVMLAA